MSPVSYHVAAQDAWLLPERALYFPALNTLIISDVHLGKVNHFRKAGIAVPTAANQANLERLITLLMVYKPSRLIFIGDLFHSHYNAEWEALAPVIAQFSACAFELLPGNHDILSRHQYERHRIHVLPEVHQLTPNIFLTHAPPEKELGHYVVCGHLHPAVSMRGRARQTVRLPCFWFSERQAVLPAFGEFTGMHTIHAQAGDKVFAILNNEVLDISLPAVKNNTDRKLKTC